MEERIVNLSKEALELYGIKIIDITISDKDWIDLEKSLGCLVRYYSDSEDHKAIKLQGPFGIIRVWKYEDKK